MLSAFTDLDGIVRAINDAGIIRFVAKPWTDTRSAHHDHPGARAPAPRAREPTARRQGAPAARRHLAAAARARAPRGRDAGHHPRALVRGRRRAARVAARPQRRRCDRHETIVRSEVPRRSGCASRAATSVAADRLNDFPWIYALYELGQSAATGVDPLQVQQDILLHIVSGLDAESGSIAMIVEGTDDLLEIVAGTDLPPGVLGSRLPRGMGVFGHVVATGAAASHQRRRRADRPAGPAARATRSGDAFGDVLAAARARADDRRARRQPARPERRATRSRISTAARCW